MAKFVPLMVALLMTAVFIISLLTAGVMLQVQNNGGSLDSDPAFNNLTAQLTGAISDSYNNTGASAVAFENSSIVTTASVPYVTSLGGIWKVIKSAPTTVYTVVVSFVFTKLVGSTAGLVLTSVAAIILILVTISAVIYWITRGEGG